MRTTRAGRRDIFLALSALWLTTMALINLSRTINRLGILNSSKQLENEKGERDYSYIGDDYPETLPLIRPMSLVQMTVENSIHYPIQGPSAKSEWDSVYPRSYGFVRLGPNHRTMCVSMFHQLHCVEKMRLALNDPEDPIATIPHLQHCMNFIRQMMLCAADTTLEPADEVVRDESGREVGTRASGVGVTHTCRDWTTVYETVEQNWDEWQEYWEEVSGDAAVV